MKILLMLSLLFLSACDNCTVKNSTVLSIGGCSDDGMCGVMTTNGKSVEKHPVVGEEIVTCVEVTK